jgi:hypothetical protein
MNTPNNGHVWKTTLAALGAVLAGAVLSWTGIKNELDRHAQDITRVQLKVESQGVQLDRVERKLDRVLERVRE